MRITAVMTAFNQEEYITEAIESLLSQSSREHEIVVVDDGSTDGTVRIVEGFKDRVRLVRRENGGLAAARNTGIEVARGEYVAFCDADDIHLPWRLAAHAELLDQAPRAAVAFGDLCTYIDGEVKDETVIHKRWLGPNQNPLAEEAERAFGGSRSCADRNVPVPEKYRQRRVYQGFIPELIASRHIAWGGASMFRRSALIAVGCHDTSFRRAPDWYIVGMLSKFYEMVFLDVPVLYYRIHGSQLTKNERAGAEAMLRVVDKVWLSDPIFCAQHKSTVDWIHAKHLYRVAMLARNTQELSLAQSMLVESLRKHPQQKRAYVDLLRVAVEDKVQRVKGALGFKLR